MPVVQKIIVDQIMIKIIDLILIYSKIYIKGEI